MKERVGKRLIHPGVSSFEDENLVGKGTYGRERKGFQ